MSLRLASLILWIASGVLIVASGLFILWALLGRVEPDLTSLDQPARTDQSGHDEPAGKLPPLLAFEVVWTRDVRPTLLSSMVEKSVVVPEPQTPAPVVDSLPFQLLGTAVEAGRSDAVFLSEDGLIVVTRVGDPIDDAKVLRIEPDRVVLERDGQTMTVLVPGQDWVEQAEEFES